MLASGDSPGDFRQAAETVLRMGNDLTVSKRRGAVARTIANTCFARQGWALTAGLWVVCLSPVAAAEEPACIEARDCYELGQAFADKGDHSEAIAAYERALARLDGAAQGPGVLIRLRLADAYAARFDESNDVADLEQACRHQAAGLQLLVKSQAVNTAEVRADLLRLLVHTLKSLAATNEPRSLDHGWRLVNELEAMVAQPVAELPTETRESLAFAIVELAEAELVVEYLPTRRARVADELEAITWIPVGAASDQLRVLVEKLRAPPKREPPTPKKPPPVEPEKRPSPLKWAGVGLMATGGVAVGVGTGLVIPPPKLLDECCLYRSTRVPGAIVLAGGVATLVTGAILYVVGKRRQQQTVAMLSPVIGERHTGFQLVGRF